MYLIDLCHHYLYQLVPMLLEAGILLQQTQSAAEHSFTISKYCSYHY